MCEKDKVKLDPNRFVYCNECKQISYRLPCCDILICTGGGCNDINCDIVFNAAWKAINDGEHPKLDDLPPVPNFQRILRSGKNEDFDRFCRS